MDGRLSGARAPAVPATHYLDNRIYIDAGVFACERERLFARSWKFVLHGSELPSPGDYRLIDLAGREVVVLRTPAGELRAFLNTCAHRGARILRAPAGRLTDGRMTCFYHLWSYDSNGHCLVIPESAGYAAAGVRKEDVRLQPVRLDAIFGLVFLCLDPEAPTLAQFLGPDITEALRVPFGLAELEVFHFHRTELRANWKLFVETNCEGYHELLHVLNRTTGVAQPEYRKRQWRCFDGGHAAFEQAQIGYQRLNWETRTSHELPGMLPNGHVVVDVFPDLMLNCRATCVRIDSLIPVAPDRTVLECRGLGVKGDAPEVRQQRIRHHNQTWGPTGTNLAEDVWAVEAQMTNMTSGASRYSLIAREEAGPMDDQPLRGFYRAWRAWTGLESHRVHGT